MSLRNVRTLPSPISHGAEFSAPAGSAKESVSRGAEFLARIGRTELETKITPETPLLYVSPEFGLNEIGPLKGRLGYAGGLGILAGDHVLNLALSGLDAEAIGLLHTQRMKPVINKDNWQDDVAVPIPSPEELGLQRRDFNVAVQVNGKVVPIDVYDLDVGGKTNLHLLHEPGLREVYPGNKEDDHRLYQMSVLGFGGWQVMEQSKKVPAKLHLNESSTALTALSMWDYTLQHMLDAGASPEQAMQESLQYVRSHTILTNHTLVPAAEAAYTKQQYEDYVLQNVQSPAIRDFMRSLIDFNSGRMKILDLSIFLAGEFNGVSKLHAQLADGVFQKQYGKLLDGGRPMVFKDVTNAVDQRWYEQFHELYSQSGILDEFDLIAPDYVDKIDHLDQNTVRRMKNERRAELRAFLEKATLGNNEPKDESGRRLPLKLSEDAVIIGWARRFADYKRPDMMLQDLDMMRSIIAKHPNVHIVYSGKTHPTDEPMKKKLQSLLNIIDSDDVLRAHVHFVQDYDIDVGKALTAGADIWVNNPRVGEEACGTSIFKAVANNALLVSTPDGGAADTDEQSYIAVKGNNEKEELSALYLGIEEALNRVSHDSYWFDKVKSQLKAFMPIVAGGRMIKDYVNFQLPAQEH